LKLLKEVKIMPSRRITLRSCLLLCLAFSALFTARAQINVEYRIENLRDITRREKNSFSDSLGMIRWFDELRFEAYRKGYLIYSVDLERTDSTHYIATGETGRRFREIELKITPEDKKFLRRAGIQPRTISGAKPTGSAVAALLETILGKLGDEGYPFAEVGLNNLEVGGDKVVTELFIRPGSQVKWTEIHLAGEKVGISQRFISNYLHIAPGMLFRQEDVDLIPLRLSQLTYLSQTKPAELLFTENGAELFLYLQGKPVSLFNGTVGLQQDPVKLNYQLTGDLRLKLQNVFRKGELFDLNWKSIQPGSPQLRLLLSYPYLFNTPFGIDGQFQLFKRDTTFLELTTGLGVNYFLTAGNVLKATYKNYQSSLLGSTSSSGSLGNVRSNQYGLSLTHQTIDYLPNPTKGLLWSVEGNVGQRTLTKDSLTTRSLIFGARMRAESYFSLARRHVVKLALTGESFQTADIQTNELLRFGGNLSQRGFMEDELLATARGTATFEYRFLLDRNSYLFTFFDQSWYERNVSSFVKDFPFGFGAGLSFGTNIGIFSLTYALGQQMGNPILIRDSKVHFGYVAYF
jgi:outer membrane protein assembly factor BamA